MGPGRGPRSSRSPACVRNWKQSSLARMRGLVGVMREAGEAGKGQSGGLGNCVKELA